MTVAVALCAPPVAGAVPLPCPSFTPARQRGTVTHPDLAEVSGLAAGRANPGVLWAHSDSGAAAELHALSGRGDLLATFELQGATNVDWEDLAVGPGPEEGRSYLYVGDIGDNRAQRDDLTVYRVPEPVVGQTPASEPVVLTDVDALRIEYPDGPEDAEALMSDPRTGDLFVVTKTATGPSRVLRHPFPQATATTTVLEPVRSLAVPSSFLPGSVVTGGDISPDGSEILLRTYFTAFVWRRGQAQPVSDALGGTRCRVPLQREPQGEAIAYRRDGNAYLTTSEWGSGGPQPLYEHRARRRPDGLIRRGAGPWAGDGIVNLTGAGQTRRATLARRGGTTFTVRVTNGGDRVDDIVVRGGPGSQRFRVRYRRGGVDVSRAVTNGTYRVGGLAPGAGVPIAVIVNARRGAPSGSRLTVGVTLTSGARDRVKAVVTRR